ncbi:LuxR family transcriptional regulator [Escherichia coli]|uniref:LuxR family transcriptional regulator n=1 Tax=Escherichia coli TaxID=562 RepID=UPI001FCE707F|nr:LuxR family transcriptional regulator [Escherichia coli]
MSDKNMVIITTTKNIYLIKSLEKISCTVFSDISVLSVDDFSFLESETGIQILCSRQVVLLPAFPDNDIATCLSSLRFVNKWLDKRHRNDKYNIPCVMWGNGGGLIHSGGAYLPWKLTHEKLCACLANYITNWNSGVNYRVVRKVSFIDLQLSPREQTVFLYTREGKDLEFRYIQ